MAVVVSALRAVWSRGRSANYNNNNNFQNVNTDGNNFCNTNTDGSANNNKANNSGAVLAGFCVRGHME